MRPTSAALALAAALSAGPALAQTGGSPPSQTPSQPSAAPNLPDAIPFGQPYGAPVGLADARKAVAAALAEAERRGWPMNVALVDTHGDLVHFARMDGAQLASVGIAQRKARSAARWRRPTAVFFEAYGKGPPIYATLDPDLAASPGGLPIVVEGRIVGALGCSGGTGDQDVVVCQAGLDALK